MSQKKIKKMFGIFEHQRSLLDSVERNVKNNDLELAFVRIELIRRNQKALEEMVEGLIERNKKKG